MRIRAFLIALVVEFAILAGAMALSHRRSAAESKSLVEPSPAAASETKRTDRGAQFQTEILAFERKRVKGEPFSATLLIEETPEGSSETRTTTSLIYRDAEGRTRRYQSSSEFNRSRKRSGSPTGSPKRFISSASQPFEREYLVIFISRQFNKVFDGLSKELYCRLLHTADESLIPSAPVA